MCNECREKHYLYGRVSDFHHLVQKWSQSCGDFLITFLFSSSITRIRSGIRNQIQKMLLFQFFTHVQRSTYLYIWSSFHWVTPLLTSPLDGASSNAVYQDHWIELFLPSSPRCTSWCWMHIPRPLGEEELHFLGHLKHCFSRAWMKKDHLNVTSFFASEPNSIRMITSKHCLTQICWWRISRIEQ